MLDLACRNPPRMIEVGGNEPPHRSVAGLVAYLAGRGIELGLARGQLRARSRTPIRADLLRLLDRAEPLILGHLQAKPVLCSDCAERPSPSSRSTRPPARSMDQ